jgi:hypothetical protein
MNSTSSDPLFFLRIESILKCPEINNNTNDVIIYSDIISFKNLPLDIIKRLQKYIKNKTANLESKLIIYRLHLNIKINYTIFKDPETIKLLKDVCEVNEKYTNGYESCLIGLIDIIICEMIGDELIILLTKLLKYMKKLDKVLYNKFSRLIDYLILLIEYLISNKEGYDNDYDYYINLIDNSIALIILCQNIKIDKNINNIIGQYLGFNICNSFINKNNEIVKLYHNPSFDDNYTQILKSDCDLYFDHAEIEKINIFLPVVDLPRYIQYLYCKKSHLKKYEFQLAFNNNVNNDYRIEIRHNFLVHSSFTNKNKIYYLKIYGIYKNEKFYYLNEEEINFCEKMGFQYKYEDNLIEEFNLLVA